MEQSKLLRQNTTDIKAALQDATVYRDRRTLWRLAQLAVTGEVSRLIARLLVCCFFLNLVYSEVETWVHTHTVEAQTKMLRWREPGLVLRPLPFPIFHTAVVLPSALLVAAGVLPWLFGLVLLGCIVWRDARLTWVMLTNVLLHKGQPPELLMKQLAMIGSTLLVIALSARCARTDTETAQHIRTSFRTAWRPGRQCQQLISLPVTSLMAAGSAPMQFPALAPKPTATFETYGMCVCLCLAGSRCP